MTTKQTVIRVPIATDNKLKEEAEMRGISKNALINYLISEYLQKAKKIKLRSGEGKNENK